MTELRQHMLEDMRIRNFAVRTQGTYISQVSKFAKHFMKSPEVLGPQEIREYQLYLIHQKVSWSVFNQTGSSLVFPVKRKMHRSSLDFLYAAFV